MVSLYLGNTRSLTSEAHGFWESYHTEYRCSDANKVYEVVSRSCGDLTTSIRDPRASQNLYVRIGWKRGV